MPTVPLERAVSGVADANGDATLLLAPSVVNERWVITRQKVINPGPSYPVVQVFLTSISDYGFVEGTRNGISGTSDTVLEVVPGETLFYVWSNCTPGTSCTVTIWGYKDYAI